ncbi:glycosyl hydrolase family 28 protein [uncultured Bacteroides sp.]|uniref:rhamnogalacturonidase n=1 Tax=uncultured Bacteroides sp. TaxID=162156 RepID=UPI002AA914F6|nr:glycosyl hydrolase family 28 protein [uncultured Bacteroides sp.]
MKLITLLLTTLISVQLFGQEKFPDGTPIPDWFSKNEIVNIGSFEHKYNITDYSVVNDSTLLQTDKIQAAIDLAAKNGGGVVIIPQGTYLSGALFFKPETHLYMEEGAVLKGSDDISNFPIKLTRMEGQTLKYFSALINADGLHGFTISGKGTINGNGLRYWRSFWLRRAVNSKCTNMDELRPRLLYISNCSDVQISGVHLMNSPFWTTHLYKCNNVKLLNLRITSPAAPVKAPSTDGVDIDACSNVLIKDCCISVNDDAIALKGGKGPWADKDKTNGSNRNIIIEDCTYGFCHSALTFGSESIHDRNIILRRCTVKDANRLLWLKMRPDTPQRYEYILVEDITGNAQSFLYIKPWQQFFDLKESKDRPMSYSDNLTMRNINFECNVFFNVNKSDQYVLTNFKFENLTIKAKKGEYDKSLINPFVLKNVKVTQ